MPEIASSGVYEEYLNIYSEWETKNLDVKLELDNKKTQYFNLQSQLQFQKSLFE